MILLDENIPAHEREKLYKHKIVYKQVATNGLQDNEIVVVLHGEKNPTFFTHDHDFYHLHLRHKSVCIVWLNVFVHQIAEYIIKFLKHTQFDTKAKRTGKLIEITTSKIRIWELNAEHSFDIYW